MDPSSSLLFEVQLGAFSGGCTEFFFCVSGLERFAVRVIDFVCEWWWLYGGVAESGMIGWLDSYCFVVGVFFK